MSKKYKHLIFKGEEIPCNFFVVENEDEIIVDFVKYNKAPQIENGYLKEDDSAIAKRLLEEYKFKIISGSENLEIDRAKFEFLKRYITDLEQLKSDVFKTVMNNVERSSLNENV